MNPDIFNELDKIATKENDILQIHQIDETVEMLWEMIDGKCCHRDFIKDVTTAINALKKVRKYC